MNKKTSIKEPALQTIISIRLIIWLSRQKMVFDRIDDFIEDMTGFRKEVSLTLFNMDRKLEDVDNRLREIEKSFDPPMRVSTLMQSEIRNLNS